MHIPYKKWAYKVHLKLLKATKPSADDASVQYQVSGCAVPTRGFLFVVNGFDCLHPLMAAAASPFAELNRSIEAKAKKVASLSHAGLCVHDCTPVVLVFSVLAAAAYCEDAGFIWICYIGF